MVIKAVLFDLDGTLLPMDYDKFVHGYFKLLAKKLAGIGYDPETLVDSIWKSTGAMVMNDGTKKNEAAFWAAFTKIYGEKALDDIPVFEDFYANDFQQVQGICGFDAAAREVVELAGQNGRKVILATNPLFPSIATESRVRWAGLDKDAFELITTYENSSYCKPNPKYYVEICEKIGCKPEECVMVGNDVSEDMIAETLGMKVFLLTNDLLNKKEQDISKYPQGGYEELKKFLKGLE